MRLTMMDPRLTTSYLGRKIRYIIKGVGRRGIQVREVKMVETK